jgi:DNA-binding response OmpR family regulator
MKDPQILLITDDVDSGRVWTYSLRHRGLDVVLLGGIQDAVRHEQARSCRFIVVDVHATRPDNLHICRELRSQVSVPILLLTAQGDETSLLEAYRAGVDECIVRPVSPALFAARVDVWLRHSGAPRLVERRLQVRDLVLHEERRAVTNGRGEVIKLTKLEFRLLRALMSNPGRVLSPHEIMDRVWGYGSGADLSVLKNLIYRLRQKIEPNPTRPSYILTEHGIGYRLRLS